MSNPIENRFGNGIIPPSKADIVCAERVQQLVLSGIIPSLRSHLVDWKLKATSAISGVGLGLLLIACGTPVKSQNTEGSSDRTNVIQPAQSVETFPTATSTPEPTPTPQTSPVEQAIREGKIEIKEPQEWEKYFTMVSAEEARRLLAEAKEKGEFKFLLPFDPRGSNVLLENYPFVNRQGIIFTYLGVRNTPPGNSLHFYSSVDGEVFIGQSGDNISGQFVPKESNPRVSNNDIQMNIYAPLDIKLASPFDKQKVPQKVKVELGDSIFWGTGSNISRNNQEYSIVFYIAFGEGIQKLEGILFKSDDPNELQKLRFTGADMKYLLRKDNKIAFISPEAPGTGKG